jgi:hypothetical protein
MTTKEKLIEFAEANGFRHRRDPFSSWRKDVVRFSRRRRKIIVYFSTAGYVVEAQAWAFRLTSRDRGKASIVAAYLAGR